MAAIIPALDGVRIPPNQAQNIGKVLFTEQQIQQRVRELAEEISQDYAGKNVLIVGLLKGAFLVVADLARNLTVENQVDFMVCSSYGAGTTSSGSIKLKKDIGIDPKGRHVIVVEDLIDTGTTLAWLKQHLRARMWRR